MASRWRHGSTVAHQVEAFLLARPRLIPHPSGNSRLFLFYFTFFFNTLSFSLVWLQEGKIILDLVSFSQAFPLQVWVCVWCVCVRGWGCKGWGGGVVMTPHSFVGGEEKKTLFASRPWEATGDPASCACWTDYLRALSRSIID